MERGREGGSEEERGICVGGINIVNKWLSEIE